jgi:hypothetical protein
LLVKGPEKDFQKRREIKIILQQNATSLEKISFCKTTPAANAGNQRLYRSWGAGKGVLFA